ncbi:hypothetical protein HCN51_05960 [Nonomuraea sp. FMUSA5-5]|uniref:Peptidase MA-like domain-containing protein n=1 Tax=Nonomuraea composti TaxID=2720023 RepID=A0ABX1B017_9ACTN|nr:hypothetical protein [Nonomuraea sp. FMUSA5-5]NJP88999.1 hypothetical protein [Nonomuraea sp. FMUSA5-5]
MHSARKKPRTLLARVLAILAALLVAALAGVALAYPSLAATTCPGCYGLAELEDSVYTEDGLSEAQQARVKQTIAEARTRITAFYGSQTSTPTLLVCVTEGCYERIGGGKERGIAVLNRAVMLSPRGLDPVIASHEMSHVELHTRLTSGAEIPQWFDEGLAVVVSDDPRYLAPKTTEDRCLASPSGPLPATLDEWLSTASKDANTYAKSACQVSRWLHANGDRTGLLSLIEHLNTGAPFASLVSPA